jgi:hypothetical protein
LVCLAFGFWTLVFGFGVVQAIWRSVVTIYERQKILQQNQKPKA